MLLEGLLPKMTKEFEETRRCAVMVRQSFLDLKDNFRRIVDTTIRVGGKNLKIRIHILSQQNKGRLEGFMESLWRDIDMRRLDQDKNAETNLVMISHGLTSHVFLMKWFKWTIGKFERLTNLGNCEFRVMQLGPGGEYTAAIHHNKEEIEQCELSQEMIADQQR